jgi:hypothetical protein
VPTRPAAVAGKVGSITIDGTAFAFSKWSIKPSGAYLDDTAFTDLGPSGLIGIVGGTVTFGGRFRPLQNPFDKTLTLTVASGIRIGNTLPVTLGLKSGCSFTVNVLITETPVDNQVTDAANFEATGQIQGLIEYPGDTVGDTGGDA